MTTQRDRFLLVGRVLLALVFVVSGLSKIGAFTGTAASIASKGLPLPELVTVVVILIEVIGGLSVWAGWKTAPAALVLAAFTLAAALLYHAFWKFPAPASTAQFNAFLDHISMIGGMLILAAAGPGALSVDARRLGSS